MKRPTIFTILLLAGLSAISEAMKLNAENEEIKEDGCAYLAQYATWAGTHSWRGGAAGWCEMPNTLIVEDTSGDGSGSTSVITQTEMPGPCSCCDHDIDVYPCIGDMIYTGTCSDGMITMTYGNKNGEAPGDYIGMVRSGTLFIRNEGNATMATGRYFPVAILD